MNGGGGTFLRRPMEYYGGLKNGCAPGTHRALVDLLVTHAPRRDGGLLDLGAGSGALLARLRDTGFTDLHAADLARDNFRLEGVAHTCVDLNADFAGEFTRRFGVVVLSETLEHLDDPRRTLRQARDLLVEGGLLALTVPNVAFWEGRFKFLLMGELWGFGENSYRSIRHISPTTATMLRLMLAEVGFEVRLVGSAGSFATLARQVLLAPLWVPFRALAGPRALGESLVVLARRADPDRSLSRPTSYANVWESSGRWRERPVDAASS